MSKIARCYVRVSFTRDGEEKESPDTQKAQIRAWCERYGYTPEWYLDVTGYQSARTSERDAFQRLIRDIETEPTAAVAFWKVSRLARNNELSQRLYRTCKERQLHLVFTANSLEFDFSNDDPFTLAMAKLLFDILASVAEFLSAEISANVRANIQTARKKGRHWGTVPMGTVRTDEGTLAPDPETMPALQRCYELYATGEHSMESVATLLNEEGVRGRWLNGELEGWTGARVRHAVTRWRTYAGHVVDGNAELEDVDIIYRNAWEPILDLDLIHRVRDVYRSRKFTKSRPPREYLLSGLMSCTVCGDTLYGQETQHYGDSVYSYYVHYGTSPHGGAATIDLNETDRAVRSMLAGLDYEQAAQRIRESAERMAAPAEVPESAEARRLAELEEQYDGLLELAGRLDSDRLYEKIVTIEREMEELRQAMQPDRAPPMPAMAVDELMLLPNWIEEAGIPECRQVVEAFFSSIEVHCEEKWLRCRFRDYWQPYFGEYARVVLPGRRSALALALRQVRYDAGWTQADLAEELGVATSTVALWETDVSTPLRRNREQLRELFAEMAPALVDSVG